MSDCENPTPSPTAVTVKICECECQCDCRCCIEQLYSEIEKNPELLQNEDKKHFAHTLLHRAAEAGQVSLAMEIMNLMPSLGKKLNPQGLSPLHLAVVNGKADVALTLVKLDKELVQVKGRGGLTPLHYAVMTWKRDDASQLELLADMLAKCPGAMAVLNNRRQSAVHVAIEHRNVEASELMVNWLATVARQCDLSIRDARGNTTLHVAARYCDGTHHQNLMKSLTKFVKVNKVNNYGETPLDIAVHHQNHMAVNMLRTTGATARKAKTQQQHHHTRKPSKTVRFLKRNKADQLPEILVRLYYFIVKELTMEMRNAILVVAVLISTATYQGVLQPPGGVYSAEGNSTVTKNNLGTAAAAFPMRRLGDLSQHPPGRMVMGTTKYSYFMPTNTLAFISSTLVIIFVLPDRAFIVILQACLIFMCISYLLALNFISYYNNFSRALDIVCGCILGVAFLMKIGYYFVKAYYNDDEWLLRGLGVMISNYKARFMGKDVSDEDEDEDLPLGTRMRKQYLLISKRAA